MVHGGLDDWFIWNGDIYIYEESQGWYDSDSELQEDDVIILVVRDSNGNMLLLGNKFKDVIRNGNGIFIMDG